MQHLTRRRGLTAAGAALATLASWRATPARAEDWPQRTVTIVIGFPPGTATDSVGRLLADRLSRSLGQRFIIDNRSGQGGSIGATIVSRAAADGYTLTIGASAPQAINPHIYPDLAYDPRKDFTPIEQLVQLPYMLVAGKHTGFRSLDDIVAKARAKPGAVTYATTGNGTTSQLLMAMLVKEAGVQMTHVPYRGTAQSVTDIVAGRVDITFDTMIGTLPFARDGRVQAIAVGTKARVPIAPDVPTTAEAGYPGAQGGAWLGMLAPAGLSPSIVQRLHTEVEKILADAAFRQAIAEMGAVVDPAGPEEFARVVRNDFDRWGEIVRVTGTKLE